MSAYQLNQKWLSQARSCQIDWRPVAGGDINDAYQIKADQRTYLQRSSRINQPAISITKNAVWKQSARLKNKTPAPLAQGQIQGDAYLVLEWLESGSGSQADLGRAVARMHAHALGSLAFMKITLPEPWSKTMRGMTAGATFISNSGWIQKLPSPKKTDAGMTGVRLTIKECAKPSVTIMISTRSSPVFCMAISGQATTCLMIRVSQS